MSPEEILRSFIERYTTLRDSAEPNSPEKSAYEDIVHRLELNLTRFPNRIAIGRIVIHPTGALDGYTPDELVALRERQAFKAKEQNITEVFYQELEAASGHPLS